ncbi:NAD(P)-dependent dehydrogenase (short-subunit alcohol dehydrogenase family) [Paenibacillus sp. SORGH_AS306]|uniref:SDR family oxidoreductase n=1 Tax=unclassified Paenibacillus TaxID=185978 RepID=UPI002365A2D6|nr:MULTISPECIES: SDR family oxidoreductase [unclassified Paenibacillus]MDQ1234404.1 NAD(P)-dependent dehydrogenase (short-subunit alcohol dehydrogenase family) [Paenibacillus sp. SORGH_AS_0306]MDR6111450.1 NAD(P)-dependent dehydrogenase (short-subunit alcohol dehydrogenase family) [Paenibacillus sp. SORGH_AS_0338]WDF52979.1 SDR family oxidoreductase [Paenibacillus sp. KACC 21273]
MESKTVALVTGANKGIGKAIVKGLAKKGITVLLGSRNVERGLEAVNDLKNDGDIHLLEIDVTNADSIKAAYQKIESMYGHLDILINNAGVAASRTKPGEADVNEFRTIYETNIFGVVAVTNEMLPLIRKSLSGRIVNISSLRGSLGNEGAFVGQPSISYSSSKTALNALTVHYARELENEGIKVNSAAPGHVATDFNDFKGKRTPEQGADIAIHLATLDNTGPNGGFFDDNGMIEW